MKKETYIRMMGEMGKRPAVKKWLPVMSGGTVLLTMMAYVGLLGYLFVEKAYEMCYHCILVPAVAFLIVSVMRRILNEKRPYEVYDITPVIPKEKKGQSFPSRHVFSIFMIGITFQQVHIGLGCLFYGLGLLLAILRVLGGVHFVKDVIAGAAMGILSGFLGYYVIF